MSVEGGKSGTGILKELGREDFPALNLPATGDASACLPQSLHSSLMLADILRACRLVLQEQFKLGRLTLVQHRANKSTATLYALDGGGSTLIGPDVIPLEESRLKQCIGDRLPQFVRFGGDFEPDTVELQHLMGCGASAVVYAPLEWQKKLKGILILALEGDADWTVPMAGLLPQASAHLALAIENSDMHYLECRRGRQLEMVSDIAKQAVLVEDLAEFLRAAAELIRTSLDYFGVQIWTIAPASPGLALAAGSSKSVTPEEPSLTSVVERSARQNNIICDNDVCSSAGEHCGSRLAVPIRLRGKLLGVLYLESDRLDAFPSQDLDTMEGVASLIASAFDNLSAFKHAQESNEYMQAILESAKHLAILSMDTLGYVMTTSVGAETIFQLPQKQIVGKDILTLFTDPRFRRELTAYIVNPEISTLERTRLSQQTKDSISYLNISLQRVFDPEKQALGFLCIAQDVTHSVKLERRLESLSVTDELTGLYNRRQFFSTITGEIERCHRFQRSISLCFFDLDRFKQYNDTHGHLKGDVALKETSDLILSLVRSRVDTCYRYGGDEFTIIMPETTIDNAQAIAERIREALNRHFQSEITASVGIASSTAALEAEDLVERADKAMYNAKALGGNRTVLSE